MRPCAYEEWEELPRVIWAQEGKCGPSALGRNLTDNHSWLDAVSDMALTRCLMSLESAVTKSKRKEPTRGARKITGSTIPLQM